MAKDTKISVSRGANKATFQKGAEIKLNNQDFAEIAKCVLSSVHAEIKKDIAKSSATKGGPVVLPDSQRFIDSFKVEVKGKRIVVTSDWPTADAHLNKDKKGPFPMKWLKKPKVSKARIVVGSSITLVRATPSGGKFWIHPGFEKYNFLDRGVRKGIQDALNKIVVVKFEEMMKKHGLPGEQ